MEHWSSWKPLHTLTATELRVLALNYQALAATASPSSVALALRKLAERYEAMAEGRVADEGE